jgi:hypothetical protein
MEEYPEGPDQLKSAPTDGVLAERTVCVTAQLNNPPDALTAGASVSKTTRATRLDWQPFGAVAVTE